MRFFQTRTVSLNGLANVTVKLLLMLLLLGVSGNLYAESKFSESGYTKILHSPTVSEPYISVQLLFYDADSWDSFFTHDAAETGHKGPAVYLDNQWICSPDYELAWPGSGDGSGKDCYDACDNYDKWWGNGYSNTIKDANNKDLTVTVKFWNPICNDHSDRTSGQRYVTMYVFLDHWQSGQAHSLRVKGKWAINKTSGYSYHDWQQRTFDFSALSMDLGVPTAKMSGNGKMKVSGKLNEAVGPTYVGTYKGAASSKLDWVNVSSLTSKEKFIKSTPSYDNLVLDFSERTNYYTTQTKAVEYAIETTPVADCPSTTVYQWYEMKVAGYIKPYSVNVVANDIWNKDVDITWKYQGAEGDNSNTDGTWSVYCYAEGDKKNRQLVLSGLSLQSRNHTIKIPGYGKKYYYDVVFVPTGADEMLRDELTATNQCTLTYDWGFSNFKAVAKNGKVELSWDHTQLDKATSSNPYEYSLLRSDDGVKYTTVLKSFRITDGGTSKGEYTDTPPSSIHTYYYKLKINLFDTEITTAPVEMNLNGTQVTEFKATRGTYSNMVKLQWTVTQAGSDLTNFIVKRRPLGSEGDEGWQEIYRIAGTASSYSYDDTTAPEGSFNQYMVTPWGQDGDKIQMSASAVTDGFCLSTGVVSGRVTYGTGTAVPDVKVTLKQQTADGEIKSGMHSLLLKGQNSGLEYADDLGNFKKLFEQDFSVQMYLYPDNGIMTVKNGVYHVFSVPGVFDIRLQYTTSGFRPTVKVSGQTEQKPNFFIPAKEWSHLTFTYSKTAKEFTVKVAGNDTIISQVLYSGDLSLSSLTSGKRGKLGIFRDCDSTDLARGFGGYVDEFRVFSYELSDKDILKNYNHPLAGNEKGLWVYYPFDEGLNSQILAYDLSKTNGTPNGRHANTIMTAFGKDFIPSSDQLSIMAYTDVDGNYTIRGVPFSGEGTSYAVQPQLGIHEFSPSMQSRFVSSSSLVHNGVDFDDISSFPVSGMVIYSLTDYPVEGVNLYVDGTICSKDGKMVETDENGEFTISVPIGQHYITVAKNGHVFANGRYPADETGENVTKVKFDRKVTGLVFRDTTLVNLTGRVVGGDIQGQKPVGAGLSKNNIGRAKIVLQPVRQGPRLNVYTNKEKGSTTVSYENGKERVTVPSDTATINSYAYRDYGSAGCRQIVIITDSLTGEFSALVPPIQYTIPPMTLAEGDLVVANATSVDLTNPLKIQADTLYDNSGGYRLYEYNTKLDETYHSAPSFTVTQHGHEEDKAFGIEKYVYADMFDTIPVSVYKVESNGDIAYNYGDDGKGGGVPLFIQDDSYIFTLHGFEEYVNADNGIVDLVPLAGSVVTINNGLSADQSVYVEDTPGNKAGELAGLHSNQMKLDSLGYATYKWKAGFPNVAEPYWRTISMMYDINGREYPWSGNGMPGIIIGDLPTGNNFVTSGPDRLLTILRDPPGTGSSAEWSSGTVTTTANLTGKTWSESFEGGTTFHFGGTLFTYTGVTTPANSTGKLTTLDSDDDQVVYALIQSDGESSTSDETSITVTHTVSTSDDPGFVGDQGDVFVGSSTNILFGKARHIGFIKDIQGKLSLGRNEVMVTGLEFATSFSYTQYYIENTLFPNYRLMLESLLVTVDSARLVNYQNTGTHPVYLTTLSPDDEHFGEMGTYRAFCPGSASFLSESTPQDKISKGLEDGTLFADSVKWVNTQIANWKSYLEFNEKEKVKAYQSRGDKDIVKTDNYSFDGGAMVSHSVEVEKMTTSTYEWTCAAGLLLENEFGFKVDGFGMDFHFHNEATGGKHVSEETGEGTVTSYSFSLVEEGSDAISVDVYEYGAFGPIFRTRGGQTSNPYEGESKTKYYQPGTAIMEATMQIEVPQINVDENIMSDVPTGTAANYVLRLSNASEIGEDVAYKLFVLDETNPSGAQISIDGKVLTEGRLIKVPGNQTLTKALQLRQTNPSILDYDRIGIVFSSESQPEDIADTIFISAHFVPSSSDVNLALSNTTMNSETGSNLTLSFSGFDRNYHNLKAFRIQYKPEGSTEWIKLHEYVLNSADKTSNNDYLPSTGSKVEYPLDMASYSDGRYVFRCLSVSTYGNSEVSKSSEEITLVKDMARPRPLGQPEPTDGVLDIGDELSIVFNETILKGELTKAANFRVTGIKNGIEVAHQIALSMNNTAQSAQTEAVIPLAGKSFSIDMWVNLTQGAGTLFTHGNGTQKLSVALDASNKLVVNIAGTEYKSSKSVPTGDWSFLTLSYQVTDDGGILNASAATDAEIITLISGKRVGAYNGNGQITIGVNMTGAIHELLLWDEAHDMTIALQNRRLTKNPSTRHLIGYWKMDEGEGTVIRDYARNHHMSMPSETWYINNINKSVILDGSEYLKLYVADSPHKTYDDYAIEFWMRAGKQTGDAQLIQAGQVSLWLTADGKLKLSNGYYIYDEDSPSAYDAPIDYDVCKNSLTDGVWHHVALNVLRQGAVAVYVDGLRKMTLNSSNVGSIATDNIIVGARRTSNVKSSEPEFDRYYNGQIDEIRIWNATLNAEKLSSDRKKRLNGKEDGLVAYYPFETKTLDTFNQVVTVGYAQDLCNLSDNVHVAISNKGQLSYSDDAPAMREKQTETNVNFSFVASDNQIIIDLNEDAPDIEGCFINFTVLDVRDVNGNYLEPVVWTAFVNRRELVWDDDDIYIEEHVKDECSVQATINNLGGSQQMWELSGLPSWLKASDEYGMLNPRDNAVITFTVSESTPVGKYDETVYISSNNGIETPLNLHITVKGNEPDWYVNSDAYYNSMNIIGSLDIMGVRSEDEADIVAAFIGEECRGLAHPVYNSRYDSYFVVMDIYGNDDEKDTLVTFRAYDASTGILYPVIDVNGDPMSIKYKSLDLIGKYDSPAALVTENLIEQDIALKKGWNWISLFIKADDMRASALFDMIKDKVVTIKNQEHYISYGKGKWGGNLNGDLSNEKMYAVNVTEDCNLRLVGHQIDASTQTVTVAEGWNWLGYYGRQVASVTDALAGLNPEDGFIIKGRSGVAYYDSYEWAGSLYTFVPGAGYKLKSPRKGEYLFSYPAKSLAAYSPKRQSAASGQEQPQATGKFNPVDYHAYPDNAIMAVQILLEGRPVEGLEIGIFAGDECRAAAFTDAQGLAFLTIPGDDYCELGFKAAYGDKVFDAPLGITYVSDAIYGTPADPMVIELMSITTGILNVNADTNSSVYDLGGRKLNISESEGLNKGIYIIDGQKKAVR